ncbi:MAG TPA: hypothetical protein VFO65_14635, partial [Acidimicrobiales bacterium]|nr:hypothetical protein [Acidimicrobiales bacterium]
MPAADPTLQSRLHDGDGPPDRAPGAAATADPTDLLGRLEGTGRFHRDAGLGRIFHPGQLSLREDVPADSLHLIVDGDRVGAHVDRVSPLGADAARAFRYSLRRAVAHNLSGMAEDLVRLLRGRQGDHRCELNCVLLRDPRDPGAAGELLDPEASSWSVQLEVRVSGSLDEGRLRA